jgi:hypothetical protein
MASIFQNDKASTAKKRQPAGSPSRIIHNHLFWSNKAYGRHCKWCETYEANWPANEMYICDSCSKV